MIDLNKLAAELHEAAVKKGFWDVEDAEAKHIAKLHSELSEAVQADRAGVLYEIEHDGGKPEGVIAELADFVMMLLDWAVYRGEVIPEMGKSDIVKQSHLGLHNLVCNMHEGVVIVDNNWFPSAPVHFIFMVQCCEEYAELQGFDLWSIIRQKMAYNESRPALHGRKY